ncbi:hypothetical protein EMCRGX_G009270 [Ephydatia muelleri]
MAAEGGDTQAPVETAAAEGGDTQMKAILSQMIAFMTDLRGLKEEMTAQHVEVARLALKRSNRMHSLSKDGEKTGVGGGREGAGRGAEAVLSQKSVILR